MEVAAEARGQRFSASDRVPGPPPKLLLNHKGKFSSSRGKTAPLTQVKVTHTTGCAEKDTSSSLGCYRQTCTAWT